MSNLTKAPTSAPSKAPTQPPAPRGQPAIVPAVVPSGAPSGTSKSKQTVSNAIALLSAAANDKNIQPDPVYSIASPTKQNKKARTPVVSKALFLRRFSQLVSLQDDLKQDHIDVCGPIAVIYAYARHKPEDFAQLCLDLMVKKKASFGGDSVLFM